MITVFHQVTNCRTECDGVDPSEELFRGSDRGSEKERKRARVFVGDSIVRKTNRVLNKGDGVVEAITERVKNIVGSGKGGSVLVHVGINNVEREGTTAIVRKCRNLVRTLNRRGLSR